MDSDGFSFLDRGLCLGHPHKVPNIKAFFDCLLETARFQEENARVEEPLAGDVILRGFCRCLAAGLVRPRVWIASHGTALDFDLESLPALQRAQSISLSQRRNCYFSCISVRAVAGVFFFHVLSLIFNFTVT